MNPRIRDWRQRRVWIVGASTGIGAALAQALLERGATVAVSARSEAALAALAQQAASAGFPDVVVLPCDVTDPAAVSAAHQSLLARWHGVDLVLYVAGAFEPMRATAFDYPAARRMTDVNLLGAFAVADAVVPQLLRQQSGAIGLVASVAGWRALPQALVYGATKAALIHFCEGLYYDLHRHGIGVHLIAPGFVATRLTAANDFPMPALLTPTQAAEAVIAGLARGEFEIHFPKRFSRVLKALQWLPYRWYFALVRAVTRL